MNMRVLGSIFATTTLVIACSGGGGSGEGGGGGGASTAGSFATQYCDSTGAVCCPKQGKTYSGETCRALFSLAGVQEGVTFDAAAADQCIAAVRAAQSQPTFCDDLGGDAVNKICDGVYKQTGGQKQPGEACQKNADCVEDPGGDTDCAYIYKSGESKRLCQVKLRAKEGDECVGDRAASSQGVSISGSSEAPRLGICWEADGLYCTGSSSSSNTAKRTCAKKIPVDGTCDPSARSACVAGTRCDFATKKCILLAAVGAPCGSSNPCVEDAHCDTAAQTCAANVPPGGACTTNNECGSGGSCTNGKCRASSNLGVSLFMCSQ